MEAALCCGRERLVKRSQEVHGEARAQDGPADPMFFSSDVLVIAYRFSRLAPATFLWKQRLAVGESDL